MMLSSATDYISLTCFVGLLPSIHRPAGCHKTDLHHFLRLTEIEFSVAQSRTDARDIYRFVAIAVPGLSMRALEDKEGASCSAKENVDEPPTASYAVREVRAALCVRGERAPPALYSSKIL